MVRPQAVRDELSRCLIEREEQIEMMLLGIISGQNVCWVGPPGTGKSLMVDSLAKCIPDAEYFGQLMHKLLPPDELSGQMMISELKQDRYIRAIAGFAPTADLVFLDEIWKSSPALLNTLMQMLNERKFRNGAMGVVQCPMRTAFAASNEWPIGDGFETTGALYDRFLIRGMVNPVSEARENDLVFGQLPVAQPVASITDVDGWMQECRQMPFSDAAVAAWTQIRSALTDNGIVIGDRRKRASASVCRASAVLNDHTEVEVSDLECLKWIFWDDPETHPEFVTPTCERIANPTRAEITAILAEAEDALERVAPRNIGGMSDTDQQAERLGCMKKLKDMQERVAALSASNGVGAAAMQYLQERKLAVRELLNLE